MSKRHYVTTAIDFPNAAPHMGHVLEKVMADVYVRWLRLSGHQVKFHIGTDENGIKIQQTAKTLGITPKELVDRNAPIFDALFRKMQISFDYFIRTSDEKSHWPTVTALWERLMKGGYLEKRTYTGLYCAGCERFWRPQDLVDGKCPDHKTVPEEITEENWFFLLSKKQKNIEKLLEPEKGSYRIIPSWRANETLAFLKEGLEDISFSRSKKTLYWGVPVPGDDDQVMYVWCDNLTSYISSLGMLTAKAEPEWWDDATVTHVIGKDIARFHAINWPAMLQCADVRTPDRLLIHGFLTSEGEKMSKSLGNVVVPEDVISKYNVDVLRFYLSHEIPVGNDGDFSWKRFGELYIGVLSNKIGNLLNRALVLLNKDGGAFTIADDAALRDGHAEMWKAYSAHMDACEFSNAVAKAVDIAIAGNVEMENKKPWTLKGDEKAAVLGNIAEMLRHVSLMLLPFMPETACKIAQQLNLPYAAEMSSKDFHITAALTKWGDIKGWKQVGTPSILFPPVETK
jgi:methionyl-tRNA synthetase